MTSATTTTPAMQTKQYKAFEALWKAYKGCEADEHGYMLNALRYLSKQDETVAGLVSGDMVHNARLAKELIGEGAFDGYYLMDVMSLEECVDEVLKEHPVIEPQPGQYLEDVLDEVLKDATPGDGAPANYLEQRVLEKEVRRQLEQRGFVEADTALVAVLEVRAALEAVCPEWDIGRVAEGCLSAYWNGLIPDLSPESVKAHARRSAAAIAAARDDGLLDFDFHY